jgi:integrase
MRYINERLPGKKSADSERQHMISLRYPFQIDGKWTWLEHVPLEGPPGSLTLTGAVAHWRADLSKIERRSYLDNQVWQRREGHWYRQPSAEGAEPPRPRVKVTDQHQIERLEATKGSGPYGPDTLRIRLAIIRSILKHAWQSDLCGTDLRARLTSAPPGPSREHFASRPQRWRLMLAARAAGYGPHLPHLLWAAVLLGWRRANLEGLTWANVHWPHENQLGYIIVVAADAKANKPIVAPMTPALERLLTKRQAHAHGPLVFHRGDGRPWGDIRKAWATAVARAGLPEGFVFHSLRHSWASSLAAAGVSDAQLMALGGWSSRDMVARYGHLRIDDLLEAARKAGGAA